MRVFFLLATLGAAVVGASPALAVVPTQEMPIAVVRALDKMTARVEEVQLTVGQSVSFGNLMIIARNCRVTLPEETPPEAAAFLQIEELHPGAPSVPVFNGWMFASSPALSAMEHPIYDLWVTGCKDNKPAEKPADAKPVEAVKPAKP